MKKIFLFIIIFILLQTAIKVNADVDSSKFVTDDGNLLTSDEELELEVILSSLEKQTSIEFAIVTMGSLEGNDIGGIANEMFRDIGLGKEDKDNGLLLLISLEDRKFRLEVGYGLEGVIPDITSSKITDALVSDFQSGTSF